MSAKIEVKNLVKTFGGLVATNNISFTVTPGQSVGLIGPNGAGKTTIFSQIMGELKQTSGDILIDDQSITSKSTPQRIRNGVCRTYQVPRPFSDMTVAENIQVGLMPNSIIQMITKGSNPERELELARAVGFKKDQLARLPSELSMGDLRKLEMARALATGPRIMLLDEVFAGLTGDEIAIISDLIQSMRKDGMTFLIVSHDLPALEPLIDHTIAINQGAIIAEGKIKDVLADDAVKASYLGGV